MNTPNLMGCSFPFYKPPCKQQPSSSRKIAVNQAPSNLIYRRCFKYIFFWCLCICKVASNNSAGPKAPVNFVSISWKLSVSLEIIPFWNDSRVSTRSILKLDIYFANVKCSNILALLNLRISFAFSGSAMEWRNYLFVAIRIVFLSDHSCEQPYQ